MSSTSSISLLTKQGVASCPCSPLLGQGAGSTNRPDRSADYAAVRNLAVSYGVDLLPLDLGFTPLKTQVVPNRAIQLSAPEPSADLPETPDVSEAAATSSAERAMEAAAAAGSSATGAASSSSKEPSTRTLGAGAGAVPAAVADKPADGHQEKPAVAAAATGLVGYPLDIDASSEGMDSGDADDCLGSGEYYDEMQLPLEHRITLLEEERDILVDKLLSTTEALHASEARNRQSQASASQVHGLLEQLQELLRRAEVERDRAKLQLKRQRLGFEAGAGTRAFRRPNPFRDVASFNLKLSSNGGTVGGSSDTLIFEGAPVRPRIKKYKVSCGGSCAGAEAASRQAVSGKEQAAAAEAAAEAAVPASGVASHGDASADTAAGLPSTASVLEPAAAGVTPVAVRRTSSSSVAAAGTGTPKRRASNSSSNGSSGDAVTPGATDQPVVTLTPSTSDARPPVKSVISGFEALLNKQRSAGICPPVVVTARASRASGTSSCSSSRSTSCSGSSRSTSPVPSVARQDGDAMAAEDDAGPDADAAGAATTVDGADCCSQPGSPKLSQNPGPDAQPSQKTYAAAAIAGAAAASAARAARAAAVKAAGSVGSGSSATSTPTAAALCNLDPPGALMLDSSNPEDEMDCVLLPDFGAAPPRLTPLRPVDRVFVSGTDGGSASDGGCSLGGIKRGRSSSPTVAAAMAQQGQAHGSLGGSVYSLSHPGRTSESAANSDPGTGSSSGTEDSSSCGAGAGRSKGHRFTSRLGLAASTEGVTGTDAAGTAAAAPAGVNTAPDDDADAAGSLALHQHQQQDAAADGQEAASTAAAAVGSAEAASRVQAQSCKLPIADVAVVERSADNALSAPAAAVNAAPAAGASRKRSHRKSSQRGKQLAANADADANVDASNIPNKALSSTAQPSKLLLVVYVGLAATTVLCIWLLYSWLAGGGNSSSQQSADLQAKLSVMQEKVVQLERQLSQRAAACAPERLGGPSIHGEL